MSYTRGKGCWPCHSTGRRADRDYQGFGAPPPILVLRFTLLGAGSPQHCPNQQGGRLKQHDFNVVCWHCHSRPSCWLRPSTGTGFCPSQGGITDTPDFFQSSTRCIHRGDCWWPEVIPAQWGLCRIINQPFHDAMAFLPHRSIFASPLRIHQQVRRLNLWIARRAQVRVINRLAC